MNNGLDPGFSVVVINGPLLFTIGIAMMLTGILAFIAGVAMAQHWRRISKSMVRSFTQALPPEPAPAPLPKLVQEIYIDADGFCLLGGDWEWLADQESDYGCPCCGQRENVLIRLYKHIPTRKVFLFARHNCQRQTAQLLDTTPIPAWKRGEE